VLLPRLSELVDLIGEEIQHINIFFHLVISVNWINIFNSRLLYMLAILLQISTEDSLLLHKVTTKILYQPFVLVGVRSVH
jgi:hypothetical protein